MKALNVDWQEAEKVKVNNGIEKQDEGNSIFTAVSSLLENLVTEITKTMDFYSEMSKQKQEVKKIILCGGGSNMKGLAQYLHDRLGKEVEVGNPWINLNLDGDLPTINKTISVRYVTAIGLAIRACNYGN